jgi:hypothetical protein
MLKQTFAVVLVAAALAAAACSDSDARLTATGPAALRSSDGPFGRAPFVGINPSILTSELINNFVACPTVQPFLVTANLLIRADGDSAIFVNSVRMRFTDTSGITAPDVTLPAPAFTRQFGTALVEARSARTFPVDFRFGCGTGRRGTLIIIVDTRDSDGRDFSTEMRATVR